MNESGSFADDTAIRYTRSDRGCRPILDEKFHDDALVATLTGKVNTFDNFHGDNQDCKSVILDPFNVKVTKTGDQSCAPGGECHFTINLFNLGRLITMRR